MTGFHVRRYNGDCNVLLLPHKDGSGYSYVNLTSGHICPCKFETETEAIADMIGKGNVIDFNKINGLDEAISSVFEKLGGES